MSNDTKTYEIESIDGRSLGAYGYMNDRRWRSEEEAREVVEKLVSYAIDWEKFRGLTEATDGFESPYKLKASDGSVASGSVQYEGLNYGILGYELPFGGRRDSWFCRGLPKLITPGVVFSVAPSQESNGWAVFRADAGDGGVSEHAVYPDKWAAQGLAKKLNEVASSIDPTAYELEFEGYDFEYELYIDGYYDRQSEEVAVPAMSAEPQEAEEELEP